MFTHKRLLVAGGVIAIAASLVFGGWFVGKRQTTDAVKVDKIPTPSPSPVTPPQVSMVPSQGKAKERAESHTLPDSSKNTTHKATQAGTPSGVNNRPLEELCPPGTGVCDTGVNNTYYDTTGVGLRGFVAAGTGTRAFNTLGITRDLGDYARTKEGVEELIGLVERYHTKAWLRLSVSDRQRELSTQAEIVEQIRKSPNDPLILVPLFMDLMDQP